MSTRISRGVERGVNISLTVDGQAMTACAGETLATVLLAAGITTFNRTRNGAPRAPYCNMGVCFECQVLVAASENDEFHWERACMCPAEAGMVIKTGAQLSAQEPGHDKD